MKAITEEVKASIANIYTKPIVKRLSGTAREEVIEHFCIPHCEKSPGEKSFCRAAEEVYKSRLNLQYKNFSQLN